MTQKERLVELENQNEQLTKENVALKEEKVNTNNFFNKKIQDLNTLVISYQNVLSNTVNKK